MTPLDPLLPKQDGTSWEKRVEKHLADSLSKSPASSLDNVIAQGAGAVGLVVKRSGASETADLLQMQDETGAVLGGLSASGAAIGGAQPATPGLRSLIGDGVTDVASALQATYDAGYRTLYLPGGSGKTYLLDTPFFMDANQQNDVVVIDLQGSRLKMGVNLLKVSGFLPDLAATWGLIVNGKRTAPVTPSTAPAWAASTNYSTGNIVTDGAGHLFTCTAGTFSGSSTPAWNTTVYATTTDGTITWTCMGTGSAADYGSGSAARAGSARNQGFVGAARLPRLIIRNGILDGGGNVTGIAFGARASSGFEDLTIQSAKYGISWTGASDSAYINDCLAGSPVSAGNETGAWLIRQVGAGDTVSMSNVKTTESLWGFFKGQLCRGFTARAMNGGAFDFTGCTALIDTWHTELFHPSWNVPAMNLNRSTVTVKHANWGAGDPTVLANNYFAVINDDTTDTSQATKLILDDCTPFSNYGSSIDPARIADIHITAANPGMKIINRSSHVTASDNQLTEAPDSMILDSAVAALTTLFTSGPNGGFPAVVAGDFILRQSGGVWVFDALQGMPAVRAYAAQAQPTGLAVVKPFSALPAISGIVTDGTTWTVTFASAHGLAAGTSITLAGFTPSGYNGAFTVATVPSSTTVTITNATSPGVITVTGTSCTTSSIHGTLTPGQAYDYTVATIDDDGLISQYATEATGTADATGILALNVTLTAPGPTNVIVWRKAAASGVASGPDVFAIIPVNNIKLKFLDSGVNIRGRAWSNSAVPVPTTSYATTTADIGRIVGPSGRLGKARQTILAMAHSCITETFSRLLCSNSTACVSGTAYGMEVGLREGDIVTGVQLYTNAGLTVGGASGLLFKVGLWKADGTLLASSADLSGNSQLTSGSRILHGAFSASYTVPADGQYFIGFIYYAGSGGAPVAPQFARSASNVTASVASGTTGVATGFAVAGATDIGNVVIASGTSITYWAGAEGTPIG